MTGRLPGPVYWIGRQLLPIPCVDVLPYRQTGSACEVGLIRRTGADGHTVGWALVGGRVRRYESLETAIVRHVQTSLGPAVQVGPVDVSRPLHVAEYSPRGNPGGRVDPAKHAIAMGYVAAVDGNPDPRDEALDFAWFPSHAVPDLDEFAFSHGDVVAEMIRRDERLNTR